MRVILAAIIVIAIFAPLANAQRASTDFGAGYSNLQLDGPNGGDDRDGFTLGEFRSRFGLSNNPSGFRVGFATDATWYPGGGGALDFNGLRPTYESISDLALTHLFGEISFILASGKKDSFYIEPAFGAGGVLASFRPRDYYNDWDFDAGWMLRPSISAGWGPVGIEAAYVIDYVDFDTGVEGEHHEWYIGIFARLGW